jgi:hypothetical protein
MAQRIARGEMDRMSLAGRKRDDGNVVPRRSTLRYRLHAATLLMLAC